MPVPSEIVTALDIERATRANTNYRYVVSTSKESQLVLMSLPPGEEIGMEVHDDNTQFIRVESGHGLAVLGADSYVLRDGIALFVPSGTRHNVINTGSEPLKLYTLYSPPHHPDGLVEKEKQQE